MIFSQLVDPWGDGGKSPKQIGYDPIIFIVFYAFVIGSSLLPPPPPPAKKLGGC